MKKYILIIVCIFLQKIFSQDRMLVCLKPNINLIYINIDSISQSYYLQLMLVLMIFWQTIKLQFMKLELEVIA